MCYHDKYIVTVMVDGVLVAKCLNCGALLR